jgi:iron-sulfur cluster assembly protein
MIVVTERARDKALALAQKDKKTPILRVAVRGGGCTGLSYVIDFVEQARATDLVLCLGDLTVVCDPKSLAYIDGTELDYESNLLKRGFRFNNPRAKQTCSCGESFTV